MEKLNHSLERLFGFKKFRPGQEEIIREIISGSNVLAVMPTGGGKSLCYQLPALLGNKVSIVVSPLIALMKDQVDSLNRNSKAAGFINSTMDWREAEEVFREIQLGRLKLLYVAPERLDNKLFADRVKALTPAYLFIDEAHCISEWGHSFRPSYRKIKAFADYTEIKKVAAFTATATPEVVRDIVAQLGMKDPKVYVRGFERENISIHVHHTRQKKAAILNLLRTYQHPAIVYSATRGKVEEVNEFLMMNGVACGCYHAGLSPILRKKVQEDFLSGKLDVISATNAFGMGIDKKDIRLIIHQQFPSTIESYYQEIGRAGRDGKPSFAVLLYEPDDVNIQEYFISSSYPDKALIQKVYAALCDYSRVPVGSRPDAELPINTDYISSICGKEVSRGLLYSALRSLQTGGYLKIISELEKRHAFQWLLQPAQLRPLLSGMRDKRKALFLAGLVREFGDAPFRGKTSFDPGSLAAQVQSAPGELLAAFNEFDVSGIIAYEKPDGKDAIRLILPRVEAGRLDLDYKRINEAFLNARRKLQEMENFIHAPGCRFSVILKYFGEETEGYRCGKCDNCGSGSHVGDAQREYLKEHILQVLAETPRPIASASVVNILRGTAASAERRSMKVYGLFKTTPREQILVAIYQLATEGYLKKAPGSVSKYMLANRGIELLESRGLTEQKPEHSGYEQTVEVFHLLREARGKAAQRFGQPVHLICSDETLRTIAQRRPVTKGEFLQVPGATERLFNKTGREFLAAIEEYLYRRGMGGAAADENAGSIPQSVQETARLIHEGYSLHDIARLRKLDETVVSMQAETVIALDKATDISNLVPAGVAHAVGEAWARGERALKDIKKLLPAEITYAQIRVVLAKLKAGS